LLFAEVLDTLPFDVPIPLFILVEFKLKFMVFVLGCWFELFADCLSEYFGNPIVFPNVSF
jgi:hypothetical protein